MAVLMNNLDQHVLWRNTDTYAFMLIYYQMPSLSASLDQIQKIGNILFYLFILFILFIYLFIYLFKFIYLFIYLFIFIYLFKKKSFFWHEIF